MDANLTFSPSEWVRDIQCHDGAALLDIRNNTCFSMNSVGSRIWQMLKLQYSTDQITDSIAAEFRLCQSQVQQDILNFLQTLSERGLVIHAGLNASRKRQHWIFRLFMRLRKAEFHEPKNRQIIE
jgi:hypothetical protein